MKKGFASTGLFLTGLMSGYLASELTRDSNYFQHNSQHSKNYQTITNHNFLQR